MTTLSLFAVFSMLVYLLMQCACMSTSLGSMNRGGRGGGKDSTASTSRRPEFSRSMSSDNWREAKKRDVDTDASGSWRSRQDYGRSGPSTYVIMFHSCSCCRCYICVDL